LAKWRSLVAIASTVLLTLVLFLTGAVAYAHGGPVTTIAGLHRIAVVGSTTNILDAHGKLITVDGNPYGVAPVGTPATGTPGTLYPGDIVVTNFGANDTGTSLVLFPRRAGPGRLFNTPNPGTNGPAAEAFNGTGNDWVANYAGNNVQIFTPAGKVAVTITSPLFNKPWGQAFNGGTHNPKNGSIAAFFSTNASDGTIDRIDIVPVNGKPTFHVYQIGALPFGTSAVAPIIALQGMVWTPIWTTEGKTYHDVLFVVDSAHNRIAAYPNSSTRNTSAARSTASGMTVYRGRPLKTPAGLALNPINGDLLSLYSSIIYNVYINMWEER